MASTIKTGVVVKNLAETIQAARTGSDDLARAPLRAIRETLGPMRDDIRRRFDQLGGTGPRVARTVRTRVSSTGAGIQMGGSSTPFAPGREFGAKRMQTRPHVRRVRSGPRRNPIEAVSTRRLTVARIPYASANIFDTWTGNQYDLGETGRSGLGKVSGRAFYPGIADGELSVMSKLGKIADEYVGLFPGAVSNTPAAEAKDTPAGQLAAFLARGGL